MAMEITKKKSAVFLKYANNQSTIFNSYNQRRHDIEDTNIKNV